MTSLSLNMGTSIFLHEKVALSFLDVSSKVLIMPETSAYLLWTMQMSRLCLAEKIG